MTSGNIRSRTLDID